MMETEEHVAAKKIKYCGNCNPDIHPKYIRHIVERMAARTGPDTLVLCKRLYHGNALQKARMCIQVGQ